MCAVYSFYAKYCDGTVVREELESHVNSMISKIKISSKLRGFLNRMGLEEEVFETALKIAISFHDIGKAFFQDNLGRAKTKDCSKTERMKPIEYLSFLGHEFLSTCMLHETLNDSTLIQLESDQWNYGFEYIKGSILFSVLYHHHALAYMERKSGILSKKKTGSMLNEGTIHYLSSMLEKHLGSDISARFEEALSLLGSEPVVTKTCLQDVTREINPFEKHRTEYISVKSAASLNRLLLSYLLVLDNLSAMESRKGRHLTPYMRAIQAFNRYYLE
ncbi:MAG: HD domain-containing protein [Desulfurococcales archaeon]|nr:HD domain-containing protein [Desulfurococcales archaeon]